MKKVRVFCIVFLRHYDELQNVISYTWLSAKRCTNGGSDFWLSIKSVSNTLSCCCFVCAFIIGQYHSGNNMNSKSGEAREILFFESEKCHKIQPLKTDTLTVSAFDAFIQVHNDSKHYLSHRLAQRRYHFTVYTVHIKLIITTTTKLELEAPKYPSVEHYVGWNVSWPASADNLVKNRLSLSSKFYSSHCGTSLHQAPMAMFYFTAKCLGSF